MSLSNVFMLAADAVWKKAFSSGSVFYAVGVSPDHRLVVARGCWDGTIQELTLNSPILRGQNPRILFLKGDELRPRLWLYAKMEDRVLRQTLPQQFNFDETDILTPSWLPTGTQAIARARNGFCCCVWRTDHEYMLSRYREGLFNERRIEALSPDDGPVSLHVHGTLPWIGCDRRVITFVEKKEISLTLSGMDWDDRITSLGDCGWNHSFPIYAATEDQVFLFPWHETQRDISPIPHSISGTVIASGLDAPVVAAIPGDWLVVASTSLSPRVLEVYRMEKAGPQLWTSANDVEDPTVAILPTNERDRFALLSRNGQIRIYKIVK